VSESADPALSDREVATLDDRDDRPLRARARIGGRASAEELLGGVLVELLGGQLPGVCDPQAAYVLLVESLEPGAEVLG